MKIEHFLLLLLANLNLIAWIVSDEPILLFTAIIYLGSTCLYYIIEVFRENN